MPHNHLRLARRLRVGFYLAFALLFGTGLGWWIVQRGAESGELPAAAFVPWLLKIHGAAAMAALFVLGILYPLHLVRGWRAHRNRTWGALLAGTCFALIATGYLLYYSGNENVRDTASAVHRWVGIALPVVVWVHVLRGRRSRVR